MSSEAKRLLLLFIFYYFILSFYLFFFFSWSIMAHLTLLRLCQDGQLTLSHFFWVGLDL